jgi:NADH:ubiquinone oxidoreductase subunit 5 (subunit L)/multisubunit Na+/H+ antiporter MnhA subunit
MMHNQDLWLLCIFTFSMLFFVTAGNLLQMFIGWESIGLCSYALINFRHTRIGANKAAIKAVFINKIGDVSFFFGIIGLLTLAGGTSEFPYILSNFAMYDKATHYTFLLLNPIDFCCLTFLIAAMAKSAQFGLHTWLTDAMEGPSPVSALIHAATMCNCRYFLALDVNRSSFILH